MVVINISNLMSMMGYRSVKVEGGLKMVDEFQIMWKNFESYLAKEIKKYNEANIWQQTTEPARQFYEDGKQFMRNRMLDLCKQIRKGERPKMIWGSKQYIIDGSGLSPRERSQLEQLARRQERPVHYNPDGFRRVD